jgi:hypothetical protein
MQMFANVCEYMQMYANASSASIGSFESRRAVKLESRQDFGTPGFEMK